MSIGAYCRHSREKREPRESRAAAIALDPSPGGRPLRAVPGIRGGDDCPRLATPLVSRNLDRVLIRVVDIDRLDRADRPGARTLHPHRDAALFEMGGDFADRRLGDKADMRRHALLAADRHRSAGGVEMDLLLAEIERRPAFPHALGLHAEHAFVELYAAVDIGDGQVQMVYALDLHVRPFGSMEDRACHDVERRARISRCFRSSRPAFWPGAGSVIWRPPTGGRPRISCPFALSSARVRSTSRSTKSPRAMSGR